jgi:hypothetical protein
MFGLLGLLLAFSFSGALSRFDDRRQLVIEEANAIATAWLRIDLLPAHIQPAARDLFRRYLDSRLATYQGSPSRDRLVANLAASAEIQHEIWVLAEPASRQGSPQAPMLLVPALNAMFDIATTHNESIRIHLPSAILMMLGILSLVCSLFAGYDMASRPRINFMHSLAFAFVMAVTVYVIVDLEFPRIGLIQISDSDRVLIDLRTSFDRE